MRPSSTSANHHHNLIATTPDYDSDALASPHLGRDSTTASANSNPSVQDDLESDNDELEVLNERAMGPPDVATAVDEFLGACEDGSAQDELKPGVQYHLVEKDFSTALYEWLDGKADAPDLPVDNSVLFRPHRKSLLRDDLVRGHDYTLVERAQWELIMQWFGGGPRIERTAYTTTSGVVDIDVCGVEISVKRSKSSSPPFKTHVTRDLRVDHLKSKLCSQYFKDIDPSDMHLSLFEGHMKKCGRLTPHDAHLAKFEPQNEDIVVVEVDADSDADERAASKKNRIVSSGPPPVKGAVGLSNLGNTCFMNSTLQCLSNVPPLRSFFLSKQFESDINASNPLGTMGKLAQSLGNLLSTMWHHDALVVSPVNTRSTIVEKKPIFQGSHQHDSQELLIFILDILHEDLNRIHTKPLTDPVESNGLVDDWKAAGEARRVFHLRNDSYINDLTECYLKSTVICPACAKISVRFDQCTCLTLPVSKPSDRAMTVVPVRVLNVSEGWAPMNQPYALRVPVDESLGELRLELADHAQLDADALVMCVVYRGEIQKKHEMLEPLVFDKLSIKTMLKGDEVVAFYHPDFARWRRSRLWASHLKWAPPLVAASSNSGGLQGEVWLGQWAQGQVRLAVTRSQGQELECSLDYDMGRFDVRSDQLVGSLGPDDLITLRSTRTSLILVGNLEDLELTVTGDGQAANNVLRFIRFKAREMRATPLPSWTLFCCANKSKVGPSYPNHEWLLPVKSSSRGADVAHAIEQGLMARVGDADLALPEMCIQSEGTLLFDLRHELLSARAGPFEGPLYNVRLIWPDAGQMTSLTSSASALAGASGSNDPSGLTIYQCLDLFGQEEKLSASEAWYCSTCKDHKQASKKLEIWSLAPLLIIHLKRFSQAESSYFVDKDESFIEYPLEGLDLNRYVLGRRPEDDYVYDLVSVSHHYGGLGGGHYTATCRNEVDGRWYAFDDSIVTCIGDTSEQAATRVCASSGYVLFYLRRGFSA